MSERIPLLLIFPPYTPLKPSLQSSDHCCPDLFFRFFSLVSPSDFAVFRSLPPAGFSGVLPSSVQLPLKLCSLPSCTASFRCADFVPWHDLVWNSVVSLCRKLVLAKPYSQQLYDYHGFTPHLGLTVSKVKHILRATIRISFTG